MSRQFPVEKRVVKQALGRVVVTEQLTSTIGHVLGICRSFPTS